MSPIQPVLDRSLVLDCNGRRLMSILAEPADGARADVGAVIVVGGPQYRAGSHRQFVLLARALAAAGYPALRFDVRGMGDSDGHLGDFESITPDIGAAIDGILSARPDLKHVLLWGLCDGASAALLYLDERHDARVKALCLLNPWVRSTQSLARTHVRHYYTHRLRQSDFWVKLLKGGVAAAALREFMRNVRNTLASSSSPGVLDNLSFQDRMARGWSSFEGSVLLLLSSDDYTAKEFEEFSKSDPQWSRALTSRPPVRIVLQHADHTCSQPEAGAAVHQLTLQFLDTLPVTVREAT